MKSEKISLEELQKFPINTYRIIVTNYNTKALRTTYDSVLLIYSPDIPISKKYISKKKYNDFKEFYELIIKEFTEIELPKFPKKIQLLEKEKTRLDYFKVLFKTLYNMAKNDIIEKEKIISLLYNFLFSEKDIQIEELSKQDVLTYFQIKDSNLKDEEEGEINNKVEEKEEEKKKILFKSPLIKFQSDKEKEENNNNMIINDILVKRYKKKYKLKTIKIENQCLMIYKNKSQNFNFLVPLYKMNIDLYRLIKPNTEKNPLKTSITKYISQEEIFKLNEKYPNFEIGYLDSEIEIQLHHDYDNSDLFVKFTSNFTINQIYNFLQIINKNYKINSENEFISEINESNSNIYGKLIVKILKLKVPKNDKNNYKIKVNLYPYIFPTKKLEYDENVDSNEYIINQKFGIPLHNKFIPLKLLVYTVSTTLLLKTESEDLIGEYSINLPDLLNNYSKENNIIIGELNSISDKKKDKEKVKGINIIFKYKNVSSLISLIMKNANKNIIENYPLRNGFEGPYKLATIMKRLKRIFMIINDIKNTFIYILHFKYPIFSFFLMIIEILFFSFCDTRYLLCHILILLLILFFCFSKTYQNYCSKYINTIFFSFKNPYDTNCSYIKSKQEDLKEIKQNNYLITSQNSKIKLPSLQDITNIRKSFSEVIFTLSKIITNIEKTKNLFLWTDPLLSLYFYIFIIGLLVFSYNLQIRFVLLLSITKKFIEGYFYYKNKYINNKEVAKIILKNAYKFYVFQTKKKEVKDNNKFLKLGFTEKFQKIILESFKIHSEIEINEDIFKTILNIEDFIEEIGKSEDLIVISKNSELFHYTINNNNIIKKKIEPEDILMYYIQNIKSDYYLASNGLIESDSDDDFSEKSE